MARLKTLRVGCLNIKIHPHSTEKYVELMKETYRLEEPGKIWGTDWGVIGTCRKKTVRKETKVLYGTVYRFLNIDPHGEWLNLRSRKPVDPEEDPEEFISVPDHLKPNCRQILYLFYPHRHRLFFQTGPGFMGPQRMRRLMLSLFSQRAIEQKFGPVDVVVQSTYEAIEKILAIPRLTTLDIVFSKPNPDDIGHYEKHIQDRIERQRINTLQQTLKSRHEKGFSLDDETLALMNVALSNGKVSGKGYDGDTLVKRSTIEHPFVDGVSFDPDREIAMDAMIHASAAMLSKISRR